MIHFAVQSVGRYTRSEQHTYSLPLCLVMFSKSGLKDFRVGGFDGFALHPFLAIIPAGNSIFQVYDHHRENWAILLETEGIRSHDDSTFQIRQDDSWIILPKILHVHSEHVAGWEGEMTRICDAFRRPTMANKMRCELGVMNVLRFFVDRQPDTFYSSPVEKLRKLIDQDATVEVSIDQLSAKCGYSTDHLRVLFREAYGLNPQEYRNNRRMARAMELITNSDLRVKEISAKTGFRYVSHFCAIFKERYGITPKEGIMKFRRMS